MNQLDYSNQPVSSSTTALQRLFSAAPGVVVLLALVLFCYHKSASFEYIWDDDAYVISNPTLDDLNGLSRIWTEVGSTPQYYPMTFTSFWLERQVFGKGAEAARPSHIINLILHAASTVLLFSILRKLKVPGAWFAAALFAVHPINIESVAWVAERKNTLSMFFGLSALLIYLYYTGLIVREKPEPDTKKEDAESDDANTLRETLPTDPSRLYFLFVLIFVMGLLSKTTISVLPIVILIIVWWKNGRIIKKDLTPLILPIILAISAGMLTSYVERNPYMVGATGEDWERPIPDRVALVGQTSWFYVGKLLAPHPFILGNPGTVTIKDGNSFPLLLDVPDSIRPYLPDPLTFNYAKWTVDSSNPLQWVALVAFILIAGALFKLRHKIGRGAFGCVICYFICLLPASGLFNFFPMQFSWVADHFVYIPAIALFILAGGIGAAIWNRIAVNARDAFAGIGATAILGWMLWVSNNHIETFADIKHLWQNTLFRNDRSWMAAGNLGFYWLEMSKPKLSLSLLSGEDSESAVVAKDYVANSTAWLKRAAEINPDAYQVSYWQSLLATLNQDFDKAFMLLDKSEKSAEKKGCKIWIYPRLGRGDLLMKLGKYEEARKIFESCKPDAKIYGQRLPHRFAHVYMQLARLHEMNIRTYDQARMTQLDRDSIAGALEEYNEAVLIAPEWSHPKLKLANVLNETGNPQLALEQIANVLKTDKQNIDAKFLSGVAAIKMNEPQAAGAQLADLLKIYPEYWPAYPKLAEALVLLNRRDEAIRELEYCIKRNPNYTPAKAALERIKNQPSTQPSTQSVK